MKIDLGNLGMNVKRHSACLPLVGLFGLALTSKCADQATQMASLTLSEEAVRTLNAQPAINRPKNAEAPSRFSADHAAHAAAYGFQAPGIAVVPLADGRLRLWLSWYQQNNNPGGGAIGGGSIPFVVYAYSDDPFGTTEPVWHRAFYLDPMPALGGDRRAHV